MVLNANVIAGGCYLKILYLSLFSKKKITLKSVNGKTFPARDSK
jgi:hypothetical protein